MALPKMDILNIGGTSYEIYDRTARESISAMQSAVNDATSNALTKAGAGNHNSIFGGNNLGSEITEAQNKAIKDRTYAGMYIGDYWTINNIKWRIAVFDYFYNVGDTNFNRGNIIVVPDTILYSTVMNDTNTTEGGYSNSKMFLEGLDEAREKVKSAFGDHVASHRIIACNATNEGKPSGWSWRDSDGIELMTENQVYGHTVWGAIGQNGYDIGGQKGQFPLFAIAPEFINTRQQYWLQNIRSSASFAYVTTYGGANNYGASTVRGVRPAVTLSHI